MNLDNMQELYVDCLRDLYDAEQQLAKALPMMEQAAANEQLKQCFRQHLEITQNQVTRLEQIFTDLEEKPTGHSCKAMQGLLEEGQEFLKAKGDESVKDAAIIGAAQKVEHYEIAGYGTAATFARLLGEDEHAELLGQTLEEEKEADRLLTEVAESMVNEEALSA